MLNKTPNELKAVLYQVMKGTCTNEFSIVDPAVANAMLEYTDIDNLSESHLKKFQKELLAFSEVYPIRIQGIIGNRRCYKMFCKQLLKIYVTHSSRDLRQFSRENPFFLTNYGFDVYWKQNKPVEREIKSENPRVHKLEYDLSVLYEIYSDEYGHGTDFIISAPIEFCESKTKYI